MRVISFLLSGEFLFAAFLLANVFKSALPELPIDLNALLFMITIAIALKRFIARPVISKLIFLPAGLFMAFAMFALFSYLYSPSQDYGLQKAILLFTLSLWCFVGPFFLITSRSSLIRFLNSFLMIVIASSIYGLITFENETGAAVRFGIEGSNSLGLGRAAALSVIIIIMLHLFNKNSSKIKRFISLLALIMLMIVLFLTLSRMALISLLIALLIYIFVKTIIIRKNKIYINKQSLKVASSIMVIPLLLIPFRDSLQFMLVRLANLFNSSGFGSYSQRTELYVIALNMWSDNILNFFLGHGIGSYTIFFDGLDERYYPHNIILEVASELGVIGLILFTALLIFPLFKNNIFRLNHLQITVLLMFIYTFMNANTTGDINDNRMMFAFLALVYMYPLFNFKKNEREKYII